MIYRQICYRLRYVESQKNIEFLNLSKIILTKTPKAVNSRNLRKYLTRIKQMFRLAKLSFANFSFREPQVMLSGIRETILAAGKWIKFLEQDDKLVN